MTSKELIKVLEVCKSLYEIKNKKRAKQKELFN